MRINNTGSVVTAWKLEVLNPSSYRMYFKYEDFEKARAVVHNFLDCSVESVGMIKLSRIDFPKIELENRITEQERDGVENMILGLLG